MMNKKTDNAGSGQKLLLAVSFGTSFEDTREKTIGAIETRIGERIPNYTVKRCFTSRIIRKKLLERDGLRIDSPEEAVLAARQRGIRELAVQPLYLMHGLEHRRLMDFLHKEAAGFDRLSIGEPLLSEDADFRIMADAICRHLPVKTPDTAVVLMGHGNAASGFRDNAVFGFLQDALREAGADNYYIATVEGEPDLMKILPRIEERGFRKVILAPFMVVAGDHARNDLAGDDEDSWKNIFLRKGFAVEAVVRGIGEWEEVQELFAAHALNCTGVYNGKDL